MIKNINPILVVFLIIAVLLFSLFFFQSYQYPILINEGGIIESLTVFGYFSCVVVMVRKGGLDFVKKYYYVILLVILLGFRELDFDKRFTTIGMLKSRFYIGDMVPVSEKIVGLLVIALLLFILFQMLRRHSRSFFQGVRIKDPLQLGHLSIIITLVFCKTVDGLGRKLSGFGLKINSQNAAYLEAIEEVLELGIPMLITATFFVFLSQNSPARSREN